MKNISLLIFLVVLIALSSGGCNDPKNKLILSADEEVISSFPGGEPKETAVFEGKEPNRLKMKSYEYYSNGKRKKEFTYKDNLYFGPWSYFYNDGTKMAEGVFDAKAIDPETATGHGSYYWPDGKKMLDLSVAEGNDKNASVITYYDSKGTTYSESSVPPELKGKIKGILEDWIQGKI